MIDSIDNYYAHSIHVRELTEGCECPFGMRVALFRKNLGKCTLAVAPLLFSISLDWGLEREIEVYLLKMGVPTNIWGV